MVIEICEDINIDGRDNIACSIGTLTQHISTLTYNRRAHTKRHNTQTQGPFSARDQLIIVFRAHIYINSKIIMVDVTVHYAPK